MLTTEELAHINVYKQLAACGWTFQSRSEMNFYAGSKVVVWEFVK